MATPLINTFQQFQLTDHEQLAGQTLNTNQLMTIQNIRAEYAIKKINLIYTPNDHQTYLQQEAEITGWLNCLNYILECHDAATSAAIEAITPDEPESGNDGHPIFS